MSLNKYAVLVVTCIWVNQPVQAVMDPAEYTTPGEGLCTAAVFQGETMGE